MAFDNSQFRLDGRTAIVTGAGGRKNSIGRAYATGLGNAGANVVVADINKDGAAEVCEELRLLGINAASCHVDISDPKSAAEMAHVAKEAFGTVHILVNNAALMAELSFEPVNSMSLDVWNRILAVNLTGALNCTQAVLPMMREAGYGRIINAVSGGAFPAQSGYGVSKLALVGLTTTLATELGREGINVNAIAPGNTMSDAGASLGGASSDGATNYFRTKLEMNVLLRVDGQPDELVGALILLASPAGAWISGQVLHVDGGWIVRP